MERINSLWLLSLGFVVCASCGRPTATVDNRISPISPTSPATEAPQSGEIPQSKTQIVVLKTDMTLRTLKSNVLVSYLTLPAGTRIQVPIDAEPVNYPYLEGTEQKFSSTGFYPRIVVLEINQPGWSESKLKDLNGVLSGLFISATIASQVGEQGPTYNPLVASAPQEAYLKYFNESGKPKTAFTSGVKSRFPNLNQGIRYKDLRPVDQTKWMKIMTELSRVGDRTQPTSKSLLIMDSKMAKQAAIDFEKNGTVNDVGAWSIAVQGTAVLNGFENVPCAEFMSEILRQAYRRAGYSHMEDFRSQNGNILSYAGGTAAVVNLSMALFKAGFIAWDPQVYVPATGAIMMHETGRSPGHTYMSAGDRGRFIVDNGSPQGRDLRKSTDRTLSIMYQTGVFFLPPGFNPKKWTDI